MHAKQILWFNIYLSSRFILSHYLELTICIKKDDELNLVIIFPLIRHQLDLSAMLLEASVFLLVISLIIVQIFRRRNSGVKTESSLLVPDWIPDTVYLAQFPPSPRVRSISPFSLKLGAVHILYIHEFKVCWNNLTLWLSQTVLGAINGPTGKSLWIIHYQSS